MLDINSFRKWLLLFFFYLCVGFCFAQLPANPIGSNRLNLKWNQINTEKIQIIFPEGLEEQAMRMANITEYLWDHSTSLGKKRKKIPIILQHQNVISNAFVIVGPFRSEVVLTPPQFDCTTDWLESVTIHEYQHVLQFANTDAGITKTVRKVLGSWAWGGMMGLALPRWFFEGDAVVAETDYTKSGRGRLPAFNMEYKSLLLNDIEYSYEKASAGSMKSFVPDWYRLGYYMTRYANEQYGDDVWEKVIDDAVRYKGLFFPFSRSLKKHTGLRTPDLYETSFNSLKSIWKNEVEKTEFTRSKDIHEVDKSTVIHYNHPIQTEDGKIITLKSGYNQLFSLVELDLIGNEKKLTEPGIMLDGEMSTLSYANQKICWSALGFDIRRRNNNFSDIYIFDLISNKKKRLTHKKRYFSPSLSPDGSQIVAVEIDDQMNSSLAILDANTGNLVNRITHQENHFLIHPKWSENGDEIIVIVKHNEMHSVASVEAAGKFFVPLTDPAPFQLSHPHQSGSEIYFSATYTGTNNIFKYSRKDGHTYQLTSDPFGAFQPFVGDDNKTLFFSSFEHTGYDLQSIALESPQKFEIPGSYFQFNKSALSTHDSNLLAKIPNKQFDIKRYRKWSNLINPHSLIPIFQPPFTGLQLLSDNTFSTLSANAGVFYNYNEEEWEYQVGLSYAELFPIIHVNYVRADRSTIFYNFDQLSDTSIVQTIFAEEWFENRFSGGFSIPLNFSRGNIFNRLQLSAFYRNISANTENRFDDPQFSTRDTVAVSQASLEQLEPIFTEILQDETFHAFDIRLSFQSLKRQARQHILPRLGINTSARIRNIFGNEDFTGPVFLGRFDLFLPGLGKTHNLYFSAMYQSENLLDNYRFSDAFIYSRGYDFTLRRDEFYKFGINYTLPLLYPDQAIGPLAFIKRIKANLFYDHGFVKIGSFPFQDRTDDMRSAGLELTFDFRALRILEVDLGLRYSYLFDERFRNNEKAHSFDFLLLRISDR